ncbi:MAG TPA: histidine--tRNA ligase, partial [Bdellovibrionales bacterium]|nr:histidine--tRNA ligase [Bdellovibrionales bacterium]
MKIQTARGTQVFYGQPAYIYEHILTTFQNLSQNFGFAPMATPIFESSAVFSRGLGESSDIVSKEMYSFNDRNGDSFTLRPEGTA